MKYTDKGKRPQTFLTCQQKELFVQRSLLFHLSHVFQGQKFIRRGGVRALVQSCHYDRERVRPNTDAHPTRTRRPLHTKARHEGRRWTNPCLKKLFLCHSAAQHSTVFGRPSRVHPSVAKTVASPRAAAVKNPPGLVLDPHVRRLHDRLLAPQARGDRFGPDAADEAPTAHVSSSTCSFISLWQEPPLLHGYVTGHLSCLQPTPPRCKMRFNDSAQLVEGFIYGYCQSEKCQHYGSTCSCIM